MSEQNLVEKAREWMRNDDTHVQTLLRKSAADDLTARDLLEFASAFAQKVRDEARAEVMDELKNVYEKCGPAYEYDSGVFRQWYERTIAATAISEIEKVK